MREAEGTRLFPFVVLAAATGARRGELLALQWADIDFTTGAIEVPAGKVFSGANPLVNTVTATVGGQPVTVLFAGVVGSGLVQINIQMPASISSGNAPVILMVGGTSTQATNNVIAVQQVAATRCNLKIQCNA